MDDGCEWTGIKLAHELIADLESLQGSWVEWKIVGKLDFRQAFIRFHTRQESVFRLRIDLIGDDESDKFDRELDE